MCGICGIISTGFKDEHVSHLNKMIASLNHRGPDSNGLWVSENRQVLFGHTRLSIIDLEERSAQPFKSFDDRFVLTFNGEIYNYLELRDECINKGSIFKTESDTEVFIECYRHWGNDCFSMFKGMWAAVIYDTIENRVCFSRDFFGIKPMFIAEYNGSIYFASEIKAFLSLGDIFKEEDTATTRLFLENAILDRGGWTFFKKIKRFPHVSYSTFKVSNTTPNLSYNIFWSPFNKSFKDKMGSEKSIIETFHGLLSNSVKLHSRSDVPVGACLSGGLDSSTIVALASKYIKNFSTFTTRFKDNPEIDESSLAQLISNKYNTTQYFTDPDSSSFKEAFNDIIKTQDEPYGSTSIFSQYMVFKKISEKGVKVVLDGQGSDEALGGYIGLTEFALNSLFRKRNYLTWLNETYKFSKNHNLNYLYKAKNYLFNSGKRNSRLEYSQLVEFKDGDEYFERLSSLTIPPSDDINNYLMYLVFDGNLQQLLRYEDRNSMRFSIESRVPFLEPDLISFICQLPPEYKFKNGYTKYILRESFKSELPKEILWQKNKLGFAAPEKSLLKELFNIDVNTNGSADWRNLIVNEWRKPYV
jgi:asparagine synthase (glutamine-hydrolysing)